MQAGRGAIRGIAEDTPSLLEMPGLRYRLSDCKRSRATKISQRCFVTRCRWQAEPRKGRFCLRTSRPAEPTGIAGRTSATCRQMRAWLGTSAQEEQNQGPSPPEYASRSA